MKCFEITEGIHSGLDIDVDPCDEPTFALGSGEGKAEVPLGYGFVRILQETGVKGRIRLKFADALQVEGGLKLTREKDHNDRRALLAVRTAPAPGGKIQLTANAYEEYEENGRVFRRYGQFPSAGVCLLAIGGQRGEGAGATTDEWEEKLLLLSPNASFRITRTGDLQGAWPEAVVTWNGFTMRSVVPRRFWTKTEGVYLPR